MSLPPESDPIEAPPKPWRRWLPLSIVAAIAGTVVIIAVASGDDEGDTTSGSTTTVAQSIPPGGSTATSDTSAGQPTTTPSTDASGSGGSTTSTSAAGAPVTTNSADPTGSTVPTTSGVATTQGTSPAPGIDLGRAADFALLGNTAVDSTGPTEVTGQIGASNGPTPSFSSAANPGGLIIVSAQAAQQGQLAVDDATAELDALASTELPAVELDTQTIGPGSYLSVTLGVTGTVTLDAGGDPNALFVFQSASTLTVAAASQIVLEGGAQACNVYWRVGSSASFGSGATFVGTVIADDSITAASGIDLIGRLIARGGSVTLDSDSIAVPACA